MNDPSITPRAKLLVVDDEARILVSLKAIFRADYDVTTAEGGAAALEALKKDHFDVIISDQRMPGITGVEVLRAARELQPHSIRLLLTGYADLNAIISSINEGEIFRFISKPWVNTDLRNTVAAAVRASAVKSIEVPAASHPAPVPTTGPAHPDVGVLLLDEDRQTEVSLREALGTERSVYVARTIDEAIGLLEHHRIGIIFTEMFVGGQEVIPLLSALRQHHPALVVAVITHKADAGHSISLINNGQIFRLLLKPVAAGVLRGTVNIASRRFELLRQHPEQSQRLAAETAPLQPAVERSGFFKRITKLLGAWN